jgi:hypothetical protein
VIVSDLQVFRETGGDHITAISPIDGEKWLETIRAFARVDSAERGAILAGRENQHRANWEDYFPKIESFLASL